MKIHDKIQMSRKTLEWINKELCDIKDVVNKKNEDEYDEDDEDYMSFLCVNVKELGNMESKVDELEIRYAFEVKNLNKLMKGLGK